MSISRSEVSRPLFEASNSDTVTKFNAGTPPQSKPYNDIEILGSLDQFRIGFSERINSG
jgi:hypothetical protein